MSAASRAFKVLLKYQIEAFEKDQMHSAQTKIRVGSEVIILNYLLLSCKIINRQQNKKIAEVTDLHN
jgi:hypothetical protein